MDRIENTFLKGSRELVEIICNNIEEIDKYTPKKIEGKGIKKSGFVKLSPSHPDGKNIVLSYFKDGGRQDFILILKHDSDFKLVQQKVFTEIKKFDTELIVVVSGQKKSPKIKKERKKKVKKTEITAEDITTLTQELADQDEKSLEKERHEDGLLHASEIVKKFQDYTCFKVINNLIDCIMGGSKEIELIFDNLFSLMSPPPAEMTNQSVISFLQKVQIEYLESICSDLQKEIQMNSENGQRLKSAGEKLAKDIEAIKEKQNELSANETDMWQRIQDLAKEGKKEDKYGKIPELINEAKLVKEEIERLEKSIPEETANLARKEEEKNILRSKIEILKAKKIAANQDIEIFKKACNHLTTSFAERSALIESQFIFPKNPKEEPTPTPPEDLPVDDIFAEFSDEQKQLLLALEAKGKDAGIGAVGINAMTALVKKNIPKSHAIAVATQGQEALEKFFQEKGINPIHAKNFIFGLQMRKVLDSEGKIDFEKIKKLISDQRKYTPKKISSTMEINATTQPTLPEKGNGSKEPIIFGCGNRTTNFEAE